MPYASEEQLRAAAGDLDRFDQLVERPAADPNWVGTSVEYWVAQMQAYGDELIDRMLAARFRTRLTEASESISQLAARIGVLQLQRRRGLWTDEDGREMERIREDLAQMRDNRQWPTDPLPQPTRGRRDVIVKATTNVSRCSLKGFV